jgi:hypothetical protein
MPHLPLDRPRAPHAAPGTGLYESHYLKATAPEGGRAVWIRLTAHQEPGGRAEGTVWCTVFDGDAVVAHRRAAGPVGDPGPGAWARLDGASIGPGSAEGAVGDCSWWLRWTARAGPVPYLPARALYDRRLPRANGVALAPDATFAGSVQVGDRRLDLEGWRGMAGHNWGADHAEHWVWVHAAMPAGWLDLLLARVRVGPVLSPWLAAGATGRPGRPACRLGGPRTAGRVRVRHDGELVEVTLPGLRLRCRRPHGETVLWDYASPGGGGRSVRNCSVADGRAELEGGTLEGLGLFAVETGEPA